MPLLKKEILQLITSVKGIETIILYSHSAKPSKSQIKVNKHVGKLQGALFLPTLIQLYFLLICRYLLAFVKSTNTHTKTLIDQVLLTVQQNVSQRCKEEEAHVQICKSGSAFPRCTNAAIFERDDPSFPYWSWCPCVYGSCH